MCADFAQKFDIIQIHEPVSVIDCDCLIIREIDKTAHLLFETFDIVRDSFRSQHFSHIGFAGRVTNHTCTASEQNNRLIAGHLEMLHQAECHEMPYMQRIRSRVESDIESCFSGVD